MLEGRDVSDTQILESTIRDADAKGLVRFRTTLPSGRTLTSEFMDADAARGTVIQWCENVRQQIEVDIAEEKAKKARGKIDFGESTPEEIRESIKEAEPTAIDYAKAQRDAYQSRVNILETRISELKTERTAIRKHLEDWERVVDALRGEVGG